MNRPIVGVIKRLPQKINGFWHFIHPIFTWFWPIVLKNRTSNKFSWIVHISHYGPKKIFERIFGQKFFVQKYCFFLLFPVEVNSFLDFFDKTRENKGYFSNKFKREKLFCSVNFFELKFFLFRKIFLFQNTRKNFGGKKINWTKKFFTEQKRLVQFKRL